MKTTLEELLRHSAALHQHLCPRQVLGVRIGLYAGRCLGLDLPQSDKRLLTLIETDGCLTDGVAVATGCTTGHRTLYPFDYGKMAATFVDTHTGQAVRIAPRPEARETCQALFPELDRWHSYLQGYQVMDDQDLLLAQPVRLRISIEALISDPNARCVCQGCGEEVFNGREVCVNGRTLCRACAGTAYYALTAPGETAEP